MMKFSILLEDRIIFVFLELSFFNVSFFIIVVPNVLYLTFVFICHNIMIRYLNQWVLLKFVYLFIFYSYLSIYVLLLFHPRLVGGVQKLLFSKRHTHAISLTVEEVTDQNFRFWGSTNDEREGFEALKE